MNSTFVTNACDFNNNKNNNNNNSNNNNNNTNRNNNNNNNNNYNNNSNNNARRRCFCIHPALSHSSIPNFHNINNAMHFCNNLMQNIRPSSPPSSRIPPPPPPPPSPVCNNSNNNDKSNSANYRNSQRRADGQAHSDVPSSPPCSPLSSPFLSCGGQAAGGAGGRHKMMMKIAKHLENKYCFYSKFNLLVASLRFQIHPVQFQKETFECLSCAGRADIIVIGLLSVAAGYMSRCIDICFETARHFGSFVHLFDYKKYLNASQLVLVLMKEEMSRHVSSLNCSQVTLSHGAVDTKDSCTYTHSHSSNDHNNCEEEKDSRKEKLKKEEKKQTFPGGFGCRFGFFKSEFCFVAIDVHQNYRNKSKHKNHFEEKQNDQKEYEEESDEDAHQALQIQQVETILQRLQFDVNEGSQGLLSEDCAVLIGTQNPYISMSKKHPHKNKNEKNNFVFLLKKTKNLPECETFQPKVSLGEFKLSSRKYGCGYAECSLLAKRADRNAAVTSFANLAKTLESEDENYTSSIRVLPPLVDLPPIRAYESHSFSFYLKNTHPSLPAVFSILCLSESRRSIIPITRVSHFHRKRHATYILNSLPYRQKLYSLRHRYNKDDAKRHNIHTSHNSAVGDTSHPPTTSQHPHQSPQALPSSLPSSSSHSSSSSSSSVETSSLSSSSSHAAWSSAASLPAGLHQTPHSNTKSEFPPFSLDTSASSSTFKDTDIIKKQQSSPSHGDKQYISSHTSDRDNRGNNGGDDENDTHASALHRHGDIHAKNGNNEGVCNAEGKTKKTGKEKEFSKDDNDGTRSVQAPQPTANTRGVRASSGNSIRNSMKNFENKQMKEKNEKQENKGNADRKIQPKEVILEKWLIVEPAEGVLLCGESQEICITIFLQEGILRAQDIASLTLVVRLDDSGKDYFFSLSTSLLPSLYCLSIPQLSYFFSHEFIRPHTNKKNNYTTMKSTCDEEEKNNDNDELDENNNNRRHSKNKNKKRESLEDQHGDGENKYEGENAKKNDEEEEEESEEKKRRDEDKKKNTEHSSEEKKEHKDEKNKQSEQKHKNDSKSGDDGGGASSAELPTPKEIWWILQHAHQFLSRSFRLQYARYNHYLRIYNNNNNVNENVSNGKGKEEEEDTEISSEALFDLCFFLKNCCTFLCHNDYTTYDVHTLSKYGSEEAQQEEEKEGCKEWRDEREDMNRQQNSSDGHRHHNNTNNISITQGSSNNNNIQDFCRNTNQSGKNEKEENDKEEEEECDSLAVTIQREIQLIRMCIESGIQIPSSVSLYAALLVLERWGRSSSLPLVPREFVVDFEGDEVHSLCRAVLLSLPTQQRNVFICVMSLMRELLKCHKEELQLAAMKKSVMQMRSNKIPSSASSSASSTSSSESSSSSSAACASSSSIFSSSSSSTSIPTPERIADNHQNAHTCREEKHNNNESDYDEEEEEEEFENKNKRSAHIAHRALAEWLARWLMWDTPPALAASTIAHFLL